MAIKLWRQTYPRKWSSNWISEQLISPVACIATRFLQHHVTMEGGLVKPHVTPPLYVIAAYWHQWENAYAHPCRGIAVWPGPAQQSMIHVGHDLLSHKSTCGNSTAPAVKSPMHTAMQIWHITSRYCVVLHGSQIVVA